MTEKRLIPEVPAVAETGAQEKQTYRAPSLVRYGSLFVSTGMPPQTTTCSIPISDKGDPCDAPPDGGPNDANLT